jgi:hypothetical protein
MLDVYVIADDCRANPITSWTVRQHPSRMPIASIRLSAGRYVLNPHVGGESVHGGLLEARDHAASLFSPSGRLH